MVLAKQLHEAEDDLRVAHSTLYGQLIVVVGGWVLVFVEVGCFKVINYNFSELQSLKLLLFCLLRGILNLFKILEFLGDLDELKVEFVSLHLCGFDEVKSLCEHVLERNDKLICLVLLNELVKRLLGVVVTSEQARNRHEKGFFLNCSLGLVGKQVAKELYHAQFYKHILLRDDLFLKHTPVVGFPSGGRRSRLLVFHLDNFSDDLQADYSQRRVDVGVNVGNFDQGLDELLHIQCVCAIERLFCFCANLNDVNHKLIKLRFKLTDERI